MQAMDHRIYPGSPCKVKSAKEILDLAQREGSGVLKARRLSLDQTSPQVGECFITHKKTIFDEIGCLEKIGVSKVVLVSEGVDVLSKEMDEHFGSLSGMAEFRKDTDVILKSIKGSDLSFSKFAHALYKGFASTEGEVFKAIRSTGIELFWAVLEAATETFSENQALKRMMHTHGSESALDVIKAWSEVFALRQRRHGKSHPFSFIGGDVSLASSALEVFKFLAEDSEFIDLIPVMEAAVPLVTKKVEMKMEEEARMKTLKESEDAIIRRNFLHFLNL